MFTAQNKNHDQFVRIKRIFDSLTSEIAHIFLLTSSHQNSQLIEQTDSLWARVNGLEVRVKQLLCEFDIRCENRQEYVEQMVSQQVALHNSPSPDPILTGIIGHDYPCLQQASIPFQEYVDEKIKTLGAVIGRYKKHLASCIQSNHAIVEKEIGNFQRHVKSALEDEVTWIHEQLTRMQTTVQQQDDQKSALQLEVKGMHAEMKNTQTTIQKLEAQISISTNMNTRVQTQGKDVDTKPQTQGDLSACMEDLSVPPPPQFSTFSPPPLIHSPNENKEDEIPAWCLTRPNKEDEKHAEIPINPMMQTQSSSSGPVLFHSVGNIPPPKFNPNIDSAENFLKELENHMERKRFIRKDWILSLPAVFNQDSNQALWWQRTKLFAHTWDEFKQHFITMYASDSDVHAALEKLLLRRQKEDEPFQKFAFEMDLQYRKVHRMTTNTKEAEIITFISERALPYLKANILGSSATTVVDLINYASKIERPVQDRSHHNSIKFKSWQKADKKVESHQANSANSARKTPPPSNNRQQQRQPQQQVAPSAQQARPKVCTYCPHLNNHTTQNCRRRPPQQVNCGQGSDQHSQRQQSSQVSSGNGGRE